MSDPKWLAEGLKLIGIKEIKGPVDNPAVVKLFADAGFPGIKDDETAWCAAFVGATLRRAGLPTTNSLMARSYEKYGTRLAQPLYGCIGVKHRSGMPNSPLGHVGYVVAANASTVWLLGGNQGDAVKVAPFKRSEFTAFRWPAGQPLGVAPPTNHVARGAATEA